PLDPQPEGPIAPGSSPGSGSSGGFHGGAGPGVSAAPLRPAPLWGDPLGKAFVGGGPPPPPAPLPPPPCDRPRPPPPAGRRPALPHVRGGSGCPASGRVRVRREAFK